MIKFLVLGAVAIICGYIGFGVSRFYTNRSKFFKSLELLFDKLKSEISFSQNKLIEIVSNFDSPSVEATKLIKNFVDCLNFDKPISKDNLFIGIKILHEEEKSFLEVFFKTLGKFDAINQTSQLENQKAELGAFYKKADEEAKRFAPLYSKLGIIVGLVIALVFA
ncbi:MAG: stage III sporulation protein AB [Clostridia bacterium]|nr:stage III sporulation protein AB [Clostridia bacterium]